jgi:hypothetical protein
MRMDNTGVVKKMFQDKKDNRRRCQGLDWDAFGRCRE